MRSTNALWRSADSAARSLARCIAGKRKSLNRVVRDPLATLFACTHALSAQRSEDYTRHIENGKTALKMDSTHSGWATKFQGPGRRRNTPGCALLSCAVAGRQAPPLSRALEARPLDRDKSNIRMDDPRLGGFRF